MPHNKSKTKSDEYPEKIHNAAVIMINLLNNVFVRSIKHSSLLYGRHKFIGIHFNIGDDKRSFYKTARKRFWEGTCDFLFIGKSAKVSSACCVEFYF